jgi:hypothetical protein
MNHDTALIIDHSDRLTSLNERVETVEEAIVELKALAVKNDARSVDVEVDMAKVKGSLDVLLPIVYAILGVSIVAFLGAMFSYFTR